MKVAIIYGWAEGSWQGKRLRKLLRERRHHVTRNAAQADVIIAHSGGCYMLPDSSRAVQVLLIGLPYWPGKHPLRSLREKVRAELKNTWWYKKSLFNTYYLLTRPHRWVKMSRAFKKRHTPNYEACSISVVRNESDTFLHPERVVDLADAHNWNLTLLPGMHDDLWIYPEKYVELIDQL